METKKTTYQKPAAIQPKSTKHKQHSPSTNKCIHGRQIQANLIRRKLARVVEALEPFWRDLLRASLGNVATHQANAWPLGTRELLGVLVGEIPQALVIYRDLLQSGLHGQRGNREVRRDLANLQNQLLVLFERWDVLIRTVGADLCGYIDVLLQHRSNIRHAVMACPRSLRA